MADFVDFCGDVLCVFVAGLGLELGLEGFEFIEVVEQDGGVDFAEVELVGGFGLFEFVGDVVLVVEWGGCFVGVGGVGGLGVEGVEEYGGGDEEGVEEGVHGVG